MHFKTLLVLTTLALSPACGAIDNAFDCDAICNRYKSCFDSSYDVAACAQRCRSDSRSDADYKRRADVCNACIDDRSCSESTFNCGSSCGGIVP